MTNLRDKAYDRHSKKDTENCFRAMQAEFLANIAENLERYNDRKNKEMHVIEVICSSDEQVPIGDVAKQTDTSFGFVVMVLSDYPGMFEITNGKINSYI